MQTNPPGFHVIFLPFADDMRKLNYPQKIEGKLILKQSEEVLHELGRQGWPSSG